MSTPFDFEDESELTFEEEDEFGRRRSPRRIMRRLPRRPAQLIKRPVRVRPRRGVRYVPIFPMIPWTAGPVDQPPDQAPTDAAPAAEPWPADAPAQNAPVQDAPADADSDAPPPDAPADADQPQGESTRVRWGQDALNRALGLELEVSGFLNAPTRSALRALQRREGLPPHGYLDRTTAAALRRRSIAKPSCGGGCGGHKPGGCGCASCRGHDA
jgi:hypothetical protein